MSKPSCYFDKQNDVLTDTDLKEIETRCHKATPGPWSCPMATTGSKFIVIGAGDELPYTLVAHTRWPNTLLAPEEDKAEKNALFIAHAREDVLRLVAEVRWL